MEPALVTISPYFPFRYRARNNIILFRHNICIVFTLALYCDMLKL